MTADSRIWWRQFRIKLSCGSSFWKTPTHETEMRILPSLCSRSQSTNQGMGKQQDEGHNIYDICIILDLELTVSLTALWPINSFFFRDGPTQTHSYLTSLICHWTQYNWAIGVIIRDLQVFKGIPPVDSTASEDCGNPSQMKLVLVTEGNFPEGLLTHYLYALWKHLSLQ